MGSQSPYALRVPEVFRDLETSPEGLTGDEARARLALYGHNVLSEPPRAPLWRRFLGRINHTLAALLLGASVVAIAAGGWYLAPIIWVVIAVNAVFSFFQEYRAQRAVEALRAILPAYARLLRDRQESTVPADEVVPGDVLVLAEGDNIPADARVVEEYGLRVNNATLNGDTAPARRTADASLRDDLTDIERPNLVFAGTSVVSGTGRAVVFASGMLTQFGRIAHLTQAVPEEPSLLEREIRTLTRRISYIALAVGAAVFFVAFFDLRMDVLAAFTLALGIIVAAVPEGLMPTVTLSLARAVQRLAQRGVLVKQLATVETLGATSVICTDKSGTLTQNQMTVREVWVGGRKLMVSGVGYEPTGELGPAADAAAVAVELEALLTAAILCNNARLIPPSPEHPRWTHLGDQTEAALRSLALKGKVDERVVAAVYPRVHELPFDARRRRMSTIHRQRRGEIAFVKGAPREVLQLCTHILLGGEVRPLDDATRAVILEANDAYARSALRVLALARRELSGRVGGYTAERVEQDLTFLGLAAMLDPPRPEVATAVQALHTAGVRMVIITGDYGLTAESFARRVGMLEGPSPRILTGVDVEAMSDAELQSALAEEVVFARVAPEHKLRVVAAFQARGAVVAVTGDGVNDAPALRRADIGVAMGVTGTDVAKEAADVVLTGDNFATIVDAIQEGRAVYDNIRKFATYIFASNMPEIVPFLLRALLSWPLALTVVQILAIDLGTDLFPALALGTELPEPDRMRRPPRSRTRPLLGEGFFQRAFLWLGLIETALCYVGFFLVYHLSGYLDGIDDLARLPQSGYVYVLATTVFHAGVVMAQVGNAFACRTEKESLSRIGWFSNRLLLGGIALEILLILALIYVPFLASWIQHQPVPPSWWQWLALYPFVLIALEEGRKALFRVVRRRRMVREGVTAV